MESNNDKDGIVGQVLLLVLFMAAAGCLAYSI